MTASTLEQVMTGWAQALRDTVIKALVVKSNNGGWNLTVFEDYSSQDDAGNYYPSSNLDKQIKWITEKLEGQENCLRQAWNIWTFKSKRDAEKFLTVYYLVWGR
jgi:hypothetical protein